jgi:hypothetical protein
VRIVEGMGRQDEGGIQTIASVEELPQVNAASSRMAGLLRERWRRLEATGQPFEDLPRAGVSEAIHR